MVCRNRDIRFGQAHHSAAGGPAIASIRTRYRRVGLGFQPNSGAGGGGCASDSRKTQKVRVVTIINDKVIDTKHSAEELAKNLSRHGIDVVLDKIDANDRPTGEVLESYAL